MDDIYEGETYDANKETNGWDKINFDDSKWKNVATVPPPTGQQKFKQMQKYELVR